MCLQQGRSGPVLPRTVDATRPCVKVRSVGWLGTCGPSREQATPAPICSFPGGCGDRRKWLPQEDGRRQRGKKMLQRAQTRSRKGQRGQDTGRPGTASRKLKWEAPREEGRAGSEERRGPVARPGAFRWSSRPQTWAGPCGRSGQPASSAASSAPVGTSRSTSYTQASCQTPQTCSSG